MPGRCKASRFKVRWDCARDIVADVDPLRINVRIDQHSDTPLEHWQDQLKRRRPRPDAGDDKPEPAPSRPPAPGPTRIDEYARPR